MHLTRRYFLQSTGALSVYLGVSPLNLLSSGSNASATAATLGGATNSSLVKRGKTLVVIFLRGGADGLNLVVPYGDPAYAKLRPGLGLKYAKGNQPNNLIDLDGFFGLHPRLGPLAPMFQSGLGVALHAVGHHQNTRSHFEEQDVWETGVIGNTVNSDGWLNRHLATSEGRGPLRAVAVGDNMPRILHGDAPAYSIRGIEDLAFPSDRIDPARMAHALEHAYQRDAMQDQDAARDLLAETANTTLDGVKQLRDLVTQPYTPAAAYPETQLGRKLKEVARLIKADIGVEVAEVDLDGWDTHQNQGQGVNGAFANLAGQLAGAIAAFQTDMADRMDDVLVLTLSDFGRTAAENGTNGTDHGWGNCMFLFGGPVAKANAIASAAGNERKVLTTWPGLGPEQLHDGRDLENTMDFRDVIAEVVRVHLGNKHLETVLPEHEFKRVGVVAT